MRGIQRKNGFIRFITSPLGVVVLVILSALFINGTWGIYSKARISAEAREASEMELNELLNRKSYVEEEIRRLKTPEGIEEEIRRKFNVVKEGEEVFLFVGEKKEATTSVQKQGFIEGFWNKTKSIFGGE